MMTPSEFINHSLERGAKLGLSDLNALERKIWLISEAEVLCDMEGIDTFLNRYAAQLLETSEAFSSIDARQIADLFREMASQLPKPPDILLDKARELITSRMGYDYESIVRLVVRERTDVT